MEAKKEIEMQGLSLLSDYIPPYISREIYHVMDISTIPLNQITEKN